MTISAEMTAHLAQGTTNLCALVKIISREGDVIALSNHTRFLDIDGTLYFPSPYDPSQVQLNAGTEPNNADMTVLLEGAFSRKQIVGGKWAGARIEAEVRNYLYPEWGIARRHVGIIGEIPMDGITATPEFRGLMDILSQEIGDFTSKRCRYQLFDEDCMLDPTSGPFFQVVDGVYEAINNQQFRISGAPPDHWYYYGQVKFLGGANSGLSYETQDSVGDVVTLLLSVRYPMQVGDAIQLTAGDDKTILTCRNKFDNAINFGGEPYMPRREDIFKFPEPPA